MILEAEIPVTSQEWRGGQGVILYVRWLPSVISPEIDKGCDPELEWGILQTLLAGKFQLKSCFIAWKVSSRNRPSRRTTHPNQNSRNPNVTGTVPRIKDQNTYDKGAIRLLKLPSKSSCLWNSSQERDSCHLI